MKKRIFLIMSVLTLAAGSSMTCSAACNVNTACHRFEKAVITCGYTFHSCRQANYCDTADCVQAENNSCHRHGGHHH